MSIRNASRSLGSSARVGVRALRSGPCLPSPSRRYASTRRASAPSASRRRGAELGAGLAIALATLYLSYPQSTKLDSDTSAKHRRAGRVISFGEVSRHNIPEDCWVIIEGKVYDLTSFAEDHPGGSAPIYRAAGRDATAIYAPLHPPGTIENMLNPEAFLGDVDPATMPKTTEKEEIKVEKEGRDITLAEIIGLPDFTEAAKRRLTSKAWAYMSAGATDEFTLDLNRSSFNKVLFRPRVMVDVKTVDTNTTMLGLKTSLPIFLCPTGMVGLSHPDGEKLLAQAAGETDTMYMISTYGSVPLPDIIKAKAHPAQSLFMQLYVHPDRSRAEQMIHRFNNMGLNAIFVTVDCATVGKREADERATAQIEAAQGGDVPGMQGGKITSPPKPTGGIAKARGSSIDPGLNWSDIAWLRRHTNLPIGLKGIQSVEDCVKAMEHGVDAILLSNHGGRSLDGAPPAMYTLLELRKHCPEVFEKCEVYIDGGVRRGTDVVKALCLGAKGVGLGRPILYSATYGKEGVLHAIGIMRDEIQTTMRLLGVTSLDQLGPHLLNTRALDPLIADESMLRGVGRSRYLNTPLKDPISAAANQE